MRADEDTNMLFILRSHCCHLSISSGLCFVQCMQYESHFCADLHSCRAAVTDEVNRPYEIELSWFGCDKERMKVICEDTHETQRWLLHLNMAAAIANTSIQVR